MKSSQLNEFIDLVQPNNFYLKRAFIFDRHKGLNPRLHIIVTFVTDNPSAKYLENIKKELDKDIVEGTKKRRNKQKPINR